MLRSVLVRALMKQNRASNFNHPSPETVECSSFVYGGHSQLYKIKQEPVNKHIEIPFPEKIDFRRFSSPAMNTNNSEAFEDYHSLEGMVLGNDFHPNLAHKALLVDAAGTLLEPTEAVTKVYLDMGRKYGVRYSEKEILDRFRRVYAEPWCHSILRYEHDGRDFWHHVLAEATGCKSTEFSEEVYKYYTSATAWRVTDPSAEQAFSCLRQEGVKLAVVSNFDTRLRAIMRDLKCDTWFDALVVSAEVNAEKPNPMIFHQACELLKVEPHEAIHVGDDRRNDVWGARDAGCYALLWGSDVNSFAEVADRLGVHVQ